MQLRQFIKLSSLALLLAFYGCDQANESTSDMLESKPASYNKELKITKTVKLRVDKETSNISANLFYFGGETEANTNLLFSLNTYLNELQIFDLNHDTLIKKIPLEMNGERGVGPIGAVFIQSLDSVFIFPTSDQRLFVIDTAGSKFKKLDYKIPEGYNAAISSSSFFSSIPVVQGKKLIAKTLYQGNYSQMTNRELSSKNLAYSIDLENGETTFMPHFFPKDYWKDGIKHYEFSVASSEKNSVYSFYGDHNLYYSDFFDSRLKKKMASSKFIKGEIEKMPTGGSSSNRGKYFAGSSHYGSIIYDKFRNVYYRICYPAVELENDANLRQIIQFPRSFSIMILDENLNIIGERLFDRNKEFVPQNVFVGKEGLYMSINHPDNPENEEDYFSFKLFEIN